VRLALLLSLRARSGAPLLRPWLGVGKQTVSWGAFLGHVSAARVTAKRRIVRTPS
jgi:hypothetical protein